MMIVEETASPSPPGQSTQSSKSVVLQQHHQAKDLWTVSCSPTRVDFTHFRTILRKQLQTPASVRNSVLQILPAQQLLGTWVNVISSSRNLSGPEQIKSSC